MATVQHDGLTFTGGLHVERDLSDMPSDRRLNAIEVGSDMAFVVYNTDAKPKKNKKSFEALWLIGPEMWFKGQITATGDLTHIDDWRAGIIQTIVSSERIGRYSGLVTRHLRLDTSFGSLKDGQDRSLFYGSEKRFAISGTSAVADIREADAPNWLAPTSYTGDPGDPVPSKPADGPYLERTEGDDHFTSYLAVAHHASRTILVLGKSSWQVSWDGWYDYPAKVWHPTSGPLQTLHYETDFGYAYPRLNHNTHSQPPFSLYLAEAEESCYISSPGGWRPATIGGDLSDRGQGRNLARWST